MNEDINVTGPADGSKIVGTGDHADAWKRKRSDILRRMNIAIKSIRRKKDVAKRADGVTR